MVRTKNKGFSLIEVVVAVAILTLLMAPIIQQVFTTLNTSAQAKERQYAVENAEYILNSFQETPLVDVLNPKTVDGNSMVAGQTLVGSPDVEGEFACDAVVAASYASFSDYRTKVKNNSINVVTDLDQALEATAEEIDEDETNTNYSGKKLVVKYAVTSYNLGSEKLGRHTYSKKTMIDNLNTQLLRNGLAVETHFNDAQKEVLASKDYQINTEGAAVHYDSSGRIDRIVCTQIKGLQDPNGVGVSYLANLDENEVAIINLVSHVDYDKEATSYFFNQNMKKLGEEGYLSEIFNEDPSSIVFGQDAYVGYTSRMVKITVNSGIGLVTETDEDGNPKQVEKKYYQVECTLHYENYLHESDTNEPDTLTRTVYKKKFYSTDKDTGNPVPPLIYLFYQPLVINDTEYANSDYIVTYDGIIYDSNEKHAKIYMVCPNTPTFTSGVKTQTVDGKKYKKFVTQYGYSSDQPVEIYLNYLQETTSGEGSPIHIYTNIWHEGAETEINPGNFNRDKVFLSSDRKGVTYNPDYYYSVYSSSDSTLVGENEENIKECTRTDYPLQYHFNDKYDYTISDFSDDRLYSNRIYTVTVQLDREGDTDKGYSVKLTGAKGVE
ncbi:MAG: prepilin-type N-terminal cleavage/methylation domain-containing protein [Eubacterium sp.]|nr:prepilin-type N-terminal cleavage/methylation domain-containing protein [Eubacterium sp.]